MYSSTCHLPLIIGPGVRAINTALSPSSRVSPNDPESMWKANATSQAPSVGVDVNGGSAEKMQGQATVQLQFSKYSPSNDHFGLLASAMDVSSCLGTESRYGDRNIAGRRSRLGPRGAGGSGRDGTHPVYRRSLAMSISRLFGRLLLNVRNRR